MIAQTYCGKERTDWEFGIPSTNWCDEHDGPCPSCLRAHIAKLESALATAEAAYAKSLDARRVTEAEGGALNQLNNEIDRLRARNAELDRLLASVPDLVKAAFQEGFASNEDGSLGPAWDKSRTKRVLDGEATPRPPSWDRDRERIAKLEARIRELEAQAAVQAIGCAGCAQKGHCAHAQYGERCEDFIQAAAQAGGVVPELSESDLPYPGKIHPGSYSWQKNEVAKKYYALAVSRAHALPASRVLGEGMRAVSVKEWAAMEACVFALRMRSRKIGKPPHPLHGLHVLSVLDALRAAKGGE